MIGLAVCLMLMTGSIFVPVSYAQDYGRNYRDLEIPNNDYWAETIAYYDALDWFEFSVIEKGGRSIDVYIMDSDQFTQYKNNLPFTAEYEDENIGSTGIVNWTCPDNEYYILVVDNRKNAHLVDAYANEDALVDIFYLNKTDKREYEQFEDIADDFSMLTMACCASMILIPVSIIAVIIFLSRSKSPPASYGPQMYPPMYPPYGPPNSYNQPQYATQYPSSQYPPHYPSSQNSPHYPSSQYPPHYPSSQYPPHYPSQGPPDPGNSIQYPPYGPPVPQYSPRYPAYISSKQRTPPDDPTKRSPSGPKVSPDRSKDDEDVTWE